MDSSSPLSTEEIFKPGFFMGNSLNSSRPITCKECNKSFSNIQLHLYNSAVCKKNYSTEQLNTLKKFSHAKKLLRGASRQRTYSENHKEKISAKKAAYYLKNQNKKFETGIGQAWIQSLHQKDLQKFQIAKEWIDILRVDDCNTKIMDTIKLLRLNLKVNWQHEGDIIPLKVSIEELENPSIVSLLKFLELTPPNEDMMEKYEPLGGHFQRNGICAVMENVMI